MTPLFSSLLGVIVRAALVAIGASLVQHGWFTSDQADALVSSETIQQILGWLTMAIPIVYSLFKQPRDLREKIAAGHLAKDATLSEIQVRAAMPDIRARDLARS